MPGRRNRIFIDADVFVSLIDKKDPNHQRAKRLNNFIEEINFDVFTSNFAFGEAITVISQNTNLKTAVSFGIKVYKSEIYILDVNKEHQWGALKRFSQQRSKNVRFTDFVNMVLMDELKIKTIFSFDRHYKKEGYKLLSV